MKLINIISHPQTVSEARFIPDYHRGTLDIGDDNNDDSSSSGYKLRMPRINKNSKHDKITTLPSTTPPIVVPVPDLNATFVFTGHFRDRVAERHFNYDTMMDGLIGLVTKHIDTIEQLPDDDYFLIRDRYRYSTVFVVERNKNRSKYIAVTMLPAIQASEIYGRHKHVFTESDDSQAIKLGDLVTMSKGMEDADFWIEYRGSANTVGKPSKEYGPYKLGIKVTATDKLDPRFLYYAFMNLQQQGHFAKMAHGTTNLVNLRIRDLANIPLGNG